MTNGSTKTISIVDGDGHIQEDYPAIAKFLPESFGNRGQRSLFPPLDHFHGAHLIETPPGRSGRGPVGPKEWVDFLEDVKIERTVLYPTWGLAYGKITSDEWAIAVTRAYNDWIYNTYLKANPRFNAMALIPMQDVDAAVVELRRAVTELGMVGAMLPSRGLSDHLGSKKYWPVYEEADRLGCAISVHGGCHDGMGFDDLNRYAPVHAMGHPIGVMIGLASIVFNGVMDRFPRMRMGFLEGGVGWYVMALERFDRSHLTHIEQDPEGIYGPHGAESPSAYMVRHVNEGRLFIGCEGEEPAIGFAVNHYGSNPFFYSSDFPHEVTNESCKEEIEELLENEDLSDAAKEDILRNNSLRFYSLSPRVQTEMAANAART